MGWKGALVEGPVWALGRLRPAAIDPRREAPREILVLRPSDFGDLLTTTPLFEALRTRFPSSRIIAGVGRWGRAVVEHNPHVDEVVEIDAPWNNKIVPDQTLADAMRYIWRSAQVEALRARGGIDVGIDVLGSHLGALLMMRAGVRYRIGVRGYRGGWSACQAHIEFSPRVHVGRAALAQGELLGASVLPEVRPQLYLRDSERDEAARIWRAGAAPGREPLRLVVGCAAGLPEKSWAPDAMGAALREISQALAQRQETVDILIVGSANDRKRAEEVIAASGVKSGIRSVAGQTSLRTTFALAEQADIALTNSSMLLHVAAAFRCPTVAVIGGALQCAPEHDVVWGYPPPYRSVGASQSVPGAFMQPWPTTDQVVSAVLQTAGECARVRGEID